MLEDPKFPQTEQGRREIAAEYVARSWEDLEVLEHAGYLLFPDELYSRNKNGTWERKKIMLRVPRDPDLRKARIEARGIAAEDGLDPDRDSDMIDDLETVCILSQAIRNNSPPFEPWEPDPRRLERQYDRGSISMCWAKLDALNHLINPAPETIDEPEMQALIAGIAAQRNILPLAGYGSGVQATLIVTMASLLTNSTGSKS